MILRSHGYDVRHKSGKQLSDTVDTGSMGSIGGRGSHDLAGLLRGF